MKKICTTLLILILILFTSIYISYFKIQTTSYTIQSDKINSEINIVMISDLHDKHCLIQDQVIKQINKLQPDIILCVGDMIDKNSTDKTNTINFLTKLNNIADVYMSIGNHEEIYPNSKQFYSLLKENGICLLDKVYEDLIINDNYIRIGGLYDIAFGQTKGDITKKDMNNNATYQYLKDYTNTDTFKLMMAHRPDSFIYHKARNWDIDLVVSGHTHGGQVILPIIGGLYAPEQKWLPEFDYGFYQLNNMKMIITRGLASGNQFIPRINNPSEIVQIKIQSN